MYYLVIRKQRENDTPAVSETVRGAYTSNVTNMWLNALFREITFQIIIVLSAIMFIIMGVPLHYCLISIPLVLILLYVIIFGSVLMKTAELIYGKKPLEAWVAEAYEPFFFDKDPQNCWYKILHENELESLGIDSSKFHKKIVGTVAVSKHLAADDWAWLFRLTVDKRYRRKGLGTELIQTVKNWCSSNHFNYLEAVISECQEEARQIFHNAGFQIRQLYHKTLLANILTLQMFQLRCEVRPTF